MPKYWVTVEFEADSLVDAARGILYPLGEQTTIKLTDMTVTEMEE